MTDTKRYEGIVEINEAHKILYGESKIDPVEQKIGSIVFEQGSMKGSGNLQNCPKIMVCDVDTLCKHLSIHAKALAAHCECLAMNAENMIAAIANISTPYPEAAYHKMMQKWGLINEKGEPLI
jgi:hypothetical protein